MSPVVTRLTLFVVIEKPPSHYVLHTDEGFHFPTGLFLHHVMNSKGFLFPLGFPPYVESCNLYLSSPHEVLSQVVSFVNLNDSLIGESDIGAMVS